MQKAFVWMMLALLTVACSGKQDETAVTPSGPSPAQPGGPRATDSITATPNPIKVCDGSGLGMTTLSWSAPGVRLVEVRVGKPDGMLFAQTGAAGTKTTGKWVGEGAVFFLQDVSGGRPLTADNTIAKVTVNLTSADCP